jgi:filamentous hemagglutinin family protein
MTKNAHFISLCVIVFVSFFYYSLNTYSQISFDGSFGPKISLSGPDYQIHAEQGRQQGPHLFHSFEQFNILSGEKATFTSQGMTQPITNIIGRITGGQTSSLYGTLISEIPDANLYLFNSAGFFIGPSATIDVEGSLYLSTADYLKFADGFQLSTTSQADSLLTVAPIEAFGFLTAPTAPIRLQANPLNISPGKDLSIIGGELSLEGTKIYATHGGRIQLASTASAGEFDHDDLSQHTASLLGKITLDHAQLFGGNPRLFYQPPPGGEIIIQGGQFFMINGSILQTYGNSTASSAIQIKMTDEIKLDRSQLITSRLKQNTGQIRFEAPKMKLIDSKITVEGDQIYFQGTDLELTENTLIKGISMTAPHGEQLRLDLKGQLLLAKSRLSTTTQEGKAGDINISADRLIMENVAIVRSGYEPEDKVSNINTSNINAGNINVQVNQLTLTDGSQINASSVGAGEGGKITVTVTGTASISSSGFLPTLQGRYEQSASGIASSAFGTGPGNTISLTAQHLMIEERGSIQTLTEGGGKAGDIKIQVEQLHLSGGGDIDASNEGQNEGQAGKIEIIANESVSISGIKLELADNTIPESENRISKPDSVGGIYSIANNERGRGGDIKLNTPVLKLQAGGVITVGSTGLGDAGKIVLEVDKRFEMDNAEIITRAIQASGGEIDLIGSSQVRLTHSAITTEARGGERQHKAGNISLHANQLTLENSQLQANAYQGPGGNINLYTTQILHTGNNKIDVSSQVGLNGQLFVNDQTIDPEVPLSKNLVSHSNWEKTSCWDRLSKGSGTNDSKTIVAWNWPPSPYDWKYDRKDKLPNHQKVRQLPDSDEKVIELLRLSDLALKNNELQQSRIILSQEVWPLVEKLHNPRISSLYYGQMGRWHQQQAEIVEAIEFTKRAIRALWWTDRGEKRYHDLLYRWHWQLGQLLVAQQQKSAAIQEYKLAIEMLQSLRLVLRTSSASWFHQHVQPVYFELAELYLQKAEYLKKSAPQAANKIAEQLKLAQQVIETFKIAEWENHFQDECQMVSQTSKIKLADAIPKGTAVLYPILLPEQIKLLLFFRDSTDSPIQYQLKTTFYSETALTRQISLWLEPVHGLPKLEILYAQRLYELLIEPLEKDLVQAQIDTLVVVPQGILRSVPFAALHDGKQFLIEKWAMAMMSSLALTDYPATQKFKENIIPFFGGLSDSVQGFPQLPAVPEELDNSYQILVGKKTWFSSPIFLNEQFTLTNFEKQLTTTAYNLVHLSTHGEFTTPLKNSFLLTHDQNHNDKLTLEKLEESLIPTGVDNQPIELLVLSACETASSDDKFEHERATLGIAGITVKTKTRSALASLWKIDNLQAAQLIPEFYRQWIENPSYSKAKALQKTQIKFLFQTKPRHWSAFVLIGNWL